VFHLKSSHEVDGGSNPGGKLNFPRGPKRRKRTLRVRIRPASSADVEGILDCLHAAFEPYRRQYTSKAYVATVLTRPMLLRRLRSMTVLVAAARNRRVIGTVAIKRVSPRHLHLRGMAVLPSHQGRGVASSLLRAAVRHARKDGHRHVTLETTEPLRGAMRFYVQRGFRPTGKHRTWGGMRLLGFELQLD
jgi:GNAT superfamily N-acetyltransferase